MLLRPPAEREDDEAIADLLDPEPVDPDPKVLPDPADRDPRLFPVRAEPRSADADFFCVVDGAPDADERPDGRVPTRASDVRLDGDVAARASDVRLDGDVATRAPDVRLDGDVATRASDVRLDGDVATRASDVRLDGDVATRVSHVRLDGDVATRVSHVRVDGDLAARVSEVRPSDHVVRPDLEDPVNRPGPSTLAGAFPAAKPGRDATKGSARLPIVRAADGTDRAGPRGEVRTDRLSEDDIDVRRPFRELSEDNIDVRRPFRELSEDNIDVRRPFRELSEDDIDVRRPFRELSEDDIDVRRPFRELIAERPGPEDPTRPPLPDPATPGEAVAVRTGARSRNDADRMDRWADPEPSRGRAAERSPRACEATVGPTRR
jgi:hypothetical protein